MKQRKNEIKMYQLHIMQTSRFAEVTSERFMRSIKKHNAVALHPNKVVDPVHILGTLLFRNPQDRLNFFNEHFK